MKVRAKNNLHKSAGTSNGTEAGALHETASPRGNRGGSPHQRSRGVDQFIVPEKVWIACPFGPSTSIVIVTVVG
jgi:hypothetical protein